MTSGGSAICVEEHETVWPDLPELAFDDRMFDLWLPVYGLDACSEIRDILRAFAAEAAVQASWRVVRSGGIYRAVSPVPTASPGRAFCTGVDDRGGFWVRNIPHLSRPDLCMVALASGPVTPPRGSAEAHLLLERLAQLTQATVPDPYTVRMPHDGKLVLRRSRIGDKELVVDLNLDGVGLLDSISLVRAEGGRSESHAWDSILRDVSNGAEMAEYEVKGGDPIVSLNWIKTPIEFATVLRDWAASAAKTHVAQYHATRACVVAVAGEEGGQALDLLLKRRNRSNRVWKWLVCSEDSAASQRRRQAISAFPGLLTIVSSEKLIPDEKLERLGASVDAGQSPVAWFQAALQCSKPAATTLLRRALEKYEVAKSSFDDLSGIASVLDALKPDLHPGRHDEATASNEWSEWSRVNLGKACLGVAYLLQTSKNAKPLWRQPNTRKNHGLPLVEFNGLRDCLATFVRQVVIPGTFGWNSAVMLKPSVAFEAPAVMQSIVGNRGHTAMLEAADLWHRRRMAIELAAIPLEGLSLAWPALCGASTFGNVAIVPLTTLSELRREGMELGHCVATYAARCLSGQSHILSVRTLDGETLSTVEISIKNRSPDDDLHSILELLEEPMALQESSICLPVSNTWLEVQQHRGHRNENPPDAAEGALKAFLEAAGNGRLEINAEECLSWAQARNRDRDLKWLGKLELERRKIEEAIMAAGYDVFDSATCASVFDAWRFFLPRQDRSLGYNEWLVKFGFDRLDLRPYADAGKSGVSWVAGVLQHGEDQNSPPDEIDQR